MHTFNCLPTAYRVRVPERKFTRSALQDLKAIYLRSGFLYQNLIQLTQLHSVLVPRGNSGPIFRIEAVFGRNNNPGPSRKTARFGKMNRNFQRVHAKKRVGSSSGVQNPNMKPVSARCPETETYSSPILRNLSLIPLYSGTKTGNGMQI